MIDIVDRLRFDATRCEVQFSRGVAGNIEEAAAEIERLRAALTAIRDYSPGTDRSSLLLRGHARDALNQQKGAEG